MLLTSEFMLIRRSYGLDPQNWYCLLMQNLGACLGMPADRMQVHFDSTTLTSSAITTIFQTAAISQVLSTY